MGRATLAADLFIDQGSIGWYAVLWLLFKQLLRGWVWPDPSHRRNDNHINSYGDAKIKFVKTEMMLFTNLGTAPFRGAGHHGSVSEAAREYFNSFDVGDALWLAMYPWISWDKNRGRLPPDFGTVED